MCILALIAIIVVVPILFTLSPQRERPENDTMLSTVASVTHHNRPKREVTESETVTPLQGEDGDFWDAWDDNAWIQHVVYSAKTFDNRVYIDAIGVPRGIPDEYKARDQIKAGFTAVIPFFGSVIETSKNTKRQVSSPPHFGQAWFELCFTSS